MTTPTDGMISAVSYWDEQWRIDSSRSAYSNPEAEVVATVPVLRQRRVRRVLDLGCGAGRHALFLARKGFEVTAIDLSGHGLQHAQAVAEADSLSIDFRRCEASALDIPDGSVDYVLTWDVIYHGDLGTLEHNVEEIARVMKAGALLQATLLSKRNHNFGVGQEVACDTWINDIDSDKAHPHCYLSAIELATLLDRQGLELLSLRDTEREKPRSFHWHLIAERVSNPSPEGGNP